MAELVLAGDEKQLFEEWWETKMAWLWTDERGPVPFTPIRFKVDSEQGIALYKQAHNGLPFEGMNSLEGFGVMDIIPEDMQASITAGTPGLLEIEGWDIDWTAAYAAQLADGGVTSESTTADLEELTWLSANQPGRPWGSRSRMHLRDTNQQDWYIVWWGLQDLDADPCQVRELILDIGDKAQAKIPIKDDIERNPLQLTWFDRAWLHTKQKGIAIGVGTDRATGTWIGKPLGFGIKNSERCKALNITSYFRPNLAQ